MYDQVIKLVAETKVVDGLGNLKPKKTEREVFAELKSIRQSEFYQAHAVGLKPEIVFILPDYLEYNNEKIVLFQDFNDENGQEYTVLRTYRNNNCLELVCKRGVD